MRRIVPLAPLLLVVACGSADPLDTDPQPDPAVLARIEPWLAGVCGAVERCAGPFAQVVPGDCSDGGGALGAHLTRLAEAVGRGRIAFDAETLDACVSGWNALSCADAPSDEAGGCPEAFAGQVVAGGACTLDEECAGDAFCSAGSPAQCGACVLRDPDGAPCTGPWGCQSRFCHPETERCAAPAPDGAPCDLDDAACASGYCNAQQRCEARAQEGGACDVEVPGCQGALVCLAPEGSRTGTCRAPASLFTAALGEPCGAPETGFCAPGAVCMLTSDSDYGPWDGECVAPVAAGEPCRNAFPSMCPAGTYCRIEGGALEGTCAPAPSAGEPCAVDRLWQTPLCADGLVCHPEGVCDPPLPVDAPCAGDFQCETHACVHGACAEPALCTR